MTTSVHTEVITLEGAAVDVTFTDQGSGRNFLVLHGGAGPQSVAGFADLMTARHGARVLTPVHPGFNGTARPERLDSIRGLARLYDALLDQLDLSGVTVVGNSVGGWIAAELALLANPRVSGLVLVNAVGLDLDDHPIADFFSLTMDQVADLAYCRPDEFRIDVSALAEPALATMAVNRETLLTYAGTSMGDKTLVGRLASIATPALVVWGVCDQIVPIAHGREYAEAIPGAQLDLIETAGHLPQLETPLRLAEDLWEFASR